MLLIICFILTFLLFSFIHFAAGSKKPFFRALLSMALGALCLCAVNLLSSVTSVYIPLTALSILTSVIGGVPGTALLVMMTMI